MTRGSSAINPCRSISSPSCPSTRSPFRVRTPDKSTPVFTVRQLKSVRYSGIRSNVERRKGIASKNGSNAISSVRFGVAVTPSNSRCSENTGVIPLALLIPHVKLINQPVTIQQPFVGVRRNMMRFIYNDQFHVLWEL